MAPSVRFACLLALGVVACATPPDARPTEPAARRAESAGPAAPRREETLEWRVLRDASGFCTSHVSSGGDWTEESAAYARLLRAPDALPALRRLLAEARPGGRLYALCGLREVEPGAAPSLATVLLDDPTEVWTLEYCASGSSSLGALARRILDDDDASMVQWRAGLRGEDPPVEPVDPTDWRAALQQLAGLEAVLGSGPPPPWSPSGEADGGLDRVARWTADEPLHGARLQLAWRLAARGPAAYPDLVWALDQASPSVRLVAVLALSALEKPWDGAVGDRIAAALEDADVRVRWFAANRLAERYPWTWPELFRAVARPGEEPGVVLAGLRAMRHWEGEAELVAPVAPLLRHAHPAVRLEAAARLASVGPAAAPALPLLREVVREGPEPEALAALGAVAALGSAHAAPVLVEALLEAEGPLQAAAAGALGELGDETAAPAVRDVLRQAAPERAQALDAATSPEARVALLVALLASEGSRAARLAAVVGLGQEGLAGVEPLARLFAWPSDEGPTRALALSALERLGPAGLCALARSPDPDGDHRAARRLGWYLHDGPPAARATTLAGLDFAPPGPEVERAFVRGLEGWVQYLDHDWATPRPEAEWQAALTVLLRWDTTEARRLVAVLAERAPVAEVRARAAQARPR